MRNQDNGGPVFPSVAGTDPRTGETMLASVGMSLRQHYAGQALIGLLSADVGRMDSRAGGGDGSNIRRRDAGRTR